MGLEIWFDVLLGKDQKEEILKLMKQAVFDSCITCGGCETNLEADCDVCGLCGWINPLVKHGLI